MTKRTILLLMAVVIGSSFATMSIESSVANGISGTNWQAGRIIDDNIFVDQNSMSVNDIQNFLNSLVPACDTNGTQPASDWGRPDLTHAQFAQSKGWPGPPFICLRDYYEVPKTSPGPGTPDSTYTKGAGQFPGSISAAQMIYNAAQQYQISPRILLVKIATESAGPLTTDTWPLQRQYTYAMGSHCPDSGPNGTAQCDPNYAGFSIQISSAASLLRYYIDNMRQPWWTYKTPYAVNPIRWSVNSNCGTGDVYISTKATAALYTYTPYQPNAAALANVSSSNSGGLGDGCSQYGNRNFWWVYNKWFGTPNYSPPSCDSRVEGVSCVWQLDGPDDTNFLTTSNSERDTAVASSRYSYDSSPFYAYTTAADSRIPVYRIRLNNEHFYTASSTERDSLLQDSRNQYEGIAFYAYQSSTSTNASYPLFRLTGSNGHVFVTDPSDRDRLVSDGFTYEGVAFNVPSGFANAPNPAAGLSNVYRISSNGEHLYTLNIAERDQLLKAGWQYEGILLASPTNPTSTPIHRLSNGRGDHLYTLSLNEKNSLTASGWLYEGIAWYIDQSTLQAYRFYINGRHFYTSSLSEAFDTASLPGVQYEGIGFGYKQDSGLPVYRLFSTAHFFTGDVNEALQASNSGWRYEGVGWYANPTTTSAPVYRLISGSRHFYTASETEKNQLVASGWRYEGVGWYANPTTTSAPVYRLISGSRHFYTASETEKNQLVASGWRYEGVGWYGPN